MKKSSGLVKGRLVLAKGMKGEGEEEEGKRKGGKYEKEVPFMIAMKLTKYLEFTMK